MTPGRFRALAGIAALLMLTGIIGLGTRFFNQRGTAPPDLGRVPDFEFIERSGEPVRRVDLAGSVWIADFIFTRCTGICPIMTTRMAEIQSTLAEDDPVRLVSVTVDPDRDTPEVLTQFAERYQADAERWLFLTGDERTIHSWIRSGFHLGVDESSGAQGTEEPFVHSPYLVLIDQKGRIRGYYDATDDAAVNRLRVDLSTLVRGKERQS